ncbi:MAG: hypothetical protein IH987_02875, partial [Planctomycetes bacterium]|nr:hypothetical protein [Planctomycetota bacterium]
STCGGDPDSNMVKGANAGVFVMMLIVYAVLFTMIGVVSAWAILPAIPDLQSGDEVSFYVRSSWDPPSAEVLQLRYSPSGGVDVGTGLEDVGDFTEILLDLDPPPLNLIVWTRVTATVPGDGRLALWHRFGPANAEVEVDAFGINQDVEGPTLPGPGETVTWTLADSPVVVDHTVYQYSSRQGLLALDADTGREKWRAPHSKSFVAQVEDRVAVWDGGSEVLLLERDSGEIVAKIPVPRRAEVVTNTLHDAIYFVERHGRVECIRPRGVPYLHQSKIVSARARLNRSAESLAADSALDKTSGETGDSRFNDPFRSRRDRAQQP